MQSVKGMRDFYPEQLDQRNWLFLKFRETAFRYGFIEYDTCVLEHEELYIRKSGEEISEQLYNFVDKGGRKLSLRPELTPSLARMILAKYNEITFPIRWFSIAQCFRYEKMQKGRKREHYQWNMDIVGDENLSAEIELLSALSNFFQSVGLDENDVVIKFSNRKILSEFLEMSMIPADKMYEVSVIIDKLDKVGVQNVSTLLVENGLDQEIVKKIIAFTQAKSIEDLESVLGYSPKAIEEINTLLDLGKEYKIDKFLRFTPSLVRGLSYYTGTVFEAFEKSGESRAICGGGRYDHLLETYGGKPTPFVGFGFGDVVISMILLEKKMMSSIRFDKKVLVAAYSDNESKEAIAVTHSLRKENIPTEIDLNYKKIGKTLARADRQGFSHVIIAAPNELIDGELLIKDLRTGTEEKFKKDSIPNSFKSNRGDITSR